MENNLFKPETNRTTTRLGFYFSMATAIVATLTFVIAVCTPPLSGPFCLNGCFEYPYLSIAERFPRDYVWMFPAILLSYLFLVTMICLYEVASSPKKVFGFISVALALLSTLILSMDYFVQISVIQPSLLAGESDGIALLSQYNPHGIFIVLEEMGFYLLVGSLFATFPLFNGKNRLEKSLKWVSIVGAFLALATLVMISVSYGIHREYRLEVAIISIAWMELIVWSILLAFYFKRTFRD